MPGMATVCSSRPGRFQTCAVTADRCATRAAAARLPSWKPWGTVQRVVRAGRLGKQDVHPRQPGAGERGLGDGRRRAVEGVHGVALGSAQVPCANLNLPLDSGLYTIPSATAVLFTVNYPNGPLPVAPTRFRLTKIIPTAGANMFDAWIVAGWNATSFQLAISGPAGDTSHQVFWEAL